MLGGYSANYLSPSFQETSKGISKYSNPSSDSYSQGEEVVIADALQRNSAELLVDCGYIDEEGEGDYLEVEVPAPHVGLCSCLICVQILCSHIYESFMQ